MVVDSALSEEEEQIVLEMVKLAGDDGIEVGETGRFLIWKEASPKGWGQAVARVSGQMSLKIPGTTGGGNWSYPPICTYLGNNNQGIIRYNHG